MSFVEQNFQVIFRMAFGLAHRCFPDDASRCEDLASEVVCYCLEAEREAAINWGFVWVVIRNRVASEGRLLARRRETQLDAEGWIRLAELVGGLDPQVEVTPERLQVEALRQAIGPNAGLQETVWCMASGVGCSAQGRAQGITRKAASQRRRRVRRIFEAVA